MLLNGPGVSSGLAGLFVVSLSGAAITSQAGWPAVVLSMKNKLPCFFQVRLKKSGQASLNLLCYACSAGSIS